MAGLFADSGSMTFAFSSPIAAVGGLLNWKSWYGALPSSISILDEDGNLIEALGLYDGGNLVAPNSFYGFQESTPIIGYFVLSGDMTGIRDLTEQVDRIPLPSTLTLFATALAVLGLMVRRKAAIAPAQG